MESTGPWRAPSGYEQFFGFHDAPFSLAVNTRFRFASASHETALAQVTYALERREPVVVVTGDIGVGKTFLCRTVVERLPRKTFLSIIHDPLVGRIDFLKRILEDFGVVSSGTDVDPSRDELAHALERFLASLGQLNAHAVVILDEAQHVQPTVLEQIRLLANIHDDRGTLLQMILVGQPDLEGVLARPELQQMRQRVSRFVRLNALTPQEVKEYISHRLIVAREAPTASQMPGAHDLARAIAEWNHSTLPATFTADAVEMVCRLSHGVPRLINLMCDRALEAAFERRSSDVEVDDVAAAASLLQLRVAGEIPRPKPPSPRIETYAGSRSRWYAAAVVGTAAAIAVAWVGGRTLNRNREEPPPIATTGNTAPRPAPEPPTQAPRDTTKADAAPRPVPNVADAPLPRAVEPPAGDNYEIIVASFKTESRATEVAGQLAALGQPVRQRSINGWQQVVAGPFESRTAADAVQDLLDRKGFSGTHIVRNSR